MRSRPSARHRAGDIQAREDGGHANAGLGRGERAIRVRRREWPRPASRALRNNSLGSVFAAWLRSCEPASSRGASNAVRRMIDEACDARAAWRCGAVGIGVGGSVSMYARREGAGDVRGRGAGTGARAPCEDWWRRISWLAAHAHAEVAVRDCLFRARPALLQDGAWDRAVEQRICIRRAQRVDSSRSGFGARASADHGAALPGQGRMCHPCTRTRVLPMYPVRTDCPTHLARGAPPSVPVHRRGRGAMLQAR